MTKLKWLCLFLLVCSPAWAQNLVQNITVGASGVVNLQTKHNSFVYFNVTLTANATTAFIDGGVAGAKIDFNICQDATGGRTWVWPPNFQNTSTITISTTASACTTAAFITPDGLTWNNANIGGGGGGGAPTANAIYVSQACSGAANCTQVLGDTTWVIDATFNSTSTVTTSAGDVPFTSADVGKIEFGNTACQLGTAVACTTYACPQGTITAVNGAHSVTVSPACTANSNGSFSVFVWGHDDGAALQSATAAMLAKQTAKSGTPINLSLPCASMMTSVNPFIANQISVPMNFSITGCGNGTVIVPLPKMNCSVGAGHGCLIDFPIPTYATAGVTPGGVIRDVTFFGGGQYTHDPAATVTANSSGIFLNFQMELDNVWLTGWLSNDSITSLAGIFCRGCAMFSSGEFAGGQGCHLQGSTNTNANMHGGTCGGDSGGIGANIFVDQSAGANDEVDFFGVYFQGGLADPLQIASGIARVFGGTALGNIRCNGGICYYEDVTKVGGGIFVAGGEQHLKGVRFNGAANLQQTSGSVFDDGGNNLPFSSFSTFTAGNPHGVTSINGTPDVVGNHVLTSGWGTSTVTTVTGDTVDVTFTISVTGAPGASPVITDTFATGAGGFWKAPNTGCFLVQTGGNFGIITNPVASSLSRTGIVWTFSGTPVNGNTYTFYRHCS